MKAALQTIRNAWNEFTPNQALALVFLATIVAGLIPIVGIVIVYRWKPADSSQRATPNNLKELPIDGEPIQFDSRDWQPGEILQFTGDVFRPSMIARAYFSEGTDERLLEFTPRPNSGEGVFRRMLILQVKRDGHWIMHGRNADWDLDGSRSECEYFEGELHGTQRVWYPNGKLHMERQWANGKENGRSRAWYADGKPQYEVINVDGKELSGKSWDENGKPR